MSLGMAAAVTKRLKVATGVCLIPQHDPIGLAKSVATLDHLSDGRFMFGIGGGWNQDEMENHGYPFNRRWKLVRERIEAMKEIWCQEKASYDGEFVQFKDIYTWPKPQQKPHPPIFLGGTAGSSLKRVARYCDGWMPIDMRMDDAAAEIKRLHDEVRGADRDPATINLSVFCQRRRSQDDLKRFRDGGFTRAIIALPNREPDEVLTFIDDYVGVGEVVG